MADLKKVTWNIVGPFYDGVTKEFYNKNKKKIDATEFPFKQVLLTEDQKEEILGYIEDKINFDIDCNFGDASTVLLNEERITYGINEFLNFNFI